MKKLFKLLIPILLIPVSLGTANAKVTKAKKVTTGESIYVLQNTNREVIASTEITSTCWFALGLGSVVLSGTMADLYSIQTQSAHGRVVNDSVKKVGELISCVVAPTGIPVPESDALYYGWPEYLNGPFSQNVNIIYSISLNEQQYFATGSGRFRTEADWELPYRGFYLLGATATVINAMGRFVGSYTINAALALPGTTENLDKQGGITVLRISDPGYSLPQSD